MLNFGRETFLTLNTAEMKVEALTSTVTIMGVEPFVRNLFKVTCYILLVFVILDDCLSLFANV
jgi:hypothetical protein